MCANVKKPLFKVQRLTPNWVLSSFFFLVISYPLCLLHPEEKGHSRALEYQKERCSISGVDSLLF